jgi:hypothetical protein
MADNSNALIYAVAIFSNMTQVVRICKYGCNTELGQFDTKQNKYHEIDGTLHTRERCESKKKGHNDLSVEVLLARLESLGISINLQKLRNVK